MGAEDVGGLPPAKDDNAAMRPSEVLAKRMTIPLHRFRDRK